MEVLQIKNSKAELLKSLNFVFLPGGKIQMGTDNPLPCRLEGKRQNEVLLREFTVNPFWINKFCVTNVEFEEFNQKHFRPPTGLQDNQPVTDLTYFDAIAYTQWLSEKYDLSFRLPTEPEWIFAAAPYGWNFTYQSEDGPDKNKAHTFKNGSYETLAVDDESLGYNYCQLLHMGGNVMEMTQGWYYAPGHYGSVTDGAYFVTKGGGFGHCANSAGVQRRIIADIVGRSNRIGFRLAHPAI